MRFIVFFQRNRNISSHIQFYKILLFIYFVYIQLCVYIINIASVQNFEFLKHKNCEVQKALFIQSADFYRSNYRIVYQIHSPFNERSVHYFRLHFSIYKANSNLDSNNLITFFP